MQLYLSFVICHLLNSYRNQKVVRAGFAQKLSLTAKQSP
ncbi:hypothetical protein MC7420_6249 [Coleofasciculus chthonoplastes PCC 7420]|uniref:Uncharacterized protein n=1 Tax=Coleofasciculus chthonoplastes PCC 7420 TaxID=118168 RepID=B4VTY7_9CYAN|nr:hypothetical protein MC7420_6249 [Coleofasciculus chthonoplastes PCC 7420]